VDRSDWHLGAIRAGAHHTSPAEPSQVPATVEILPAAEQSRSIGEEFAVGETMLGSPSDSEDRSMVRRRELCLDLDLQSILPCDLVDALFALGDWA
jgi:hypothetical protein